MLTAETSEIYSYVLSLSLSVFFAFFFFSASFTLFVSLPPFRYILKYLYVTGFMHAIEMYAVVENVCQVHIFDPYECLMDLCNEL